MNKKRREQALQNLKPANEIEKKAISYYFNEVVNNNSATSAVTSAKGEPFAFFDGGIKWRSGKWEDGKDKWNLHYVEVKERTEEKVYDEEFLNIEKLADLQSDVINEFKRKHPNYASDDNNLIKLIWISVYPKAGKIFIWDVYEQFRRGNVKSCVRFVPPHTYESIKKKDEQKMLQMRLLLPIDKADYTADVDINGYQIH